MTLEVGRFFVPDDLPLSGAALTLRALLAAGLVEDELGGEPEQLAALLEGGPPPAVLGIVHALRRDHPRIADIAPLLDREIEPLVDDGEERPLYVYFRLKAPAELPSEALRRAYQTVHGQLHGGPGDFYVVHPFEAWLAIDLTSPRGENAARFLASRRTTAFEGFPRPIEIVEGKATTPSQLGPGFELRTTVENARYLAFALEHAGLLVGRRRVVFEILD
jgi:hypothetical protein